MPLDYQKDAHLTVPLRPELFRVIMVIVVLIILTKNVSKMPQHVLNERKKKCTLYVFHVHTQRAHDVNITSPQRRCNVMTLHRR